MVAVYSSSNSEVILPPGPGYNTLVSLTAGNGNLYMAGGAVNAAWENTGSVAKISALIDNQWLTLPETAFLDPLRIVEGKDNNFFVSTWGMGLLEYSGTDLINHYNQNNSPLNSSVDRKSVV